MHTALSATVPVFMRDCGTYLTLKVSKTRLYHNFIKYSIWKCRKWTGSGIVEYYLKIFAFINFIYLSRFFILKKMNKK